MKRMMAVALLVLGGCGENVESQLAACKGEMRDHMKALAGLKQELDKNKVPPSAGISLALIEVFVMEKWQGQEGLAKCRDTLAKWKAELAKLKAQGR